MRTSTFERKTKETDIRLDLDLDRAGDAEADTELPFLNHMLEAFATHGRFGLAMRARGDLAVDPHHLVEDCGIALGTAVAQALAQGGAVQRAGCFSFPMDGSLASAAVDLCGRPNLVWTVALEKTPLGTVVPDLFRDFFKGLTDGLRATVHLAVPYKDNDHHALEAVFKAFGRALRQAVEPVGGAGPLSSKGRIDD